MPFPKTTLLAVKVERPVPPSATAKSVIPVIDPPVIETLLAFWVDIVPKEPVAVVTAALTKAVVAICVLFVPGEAVVDIGAPVNVGDVDKTMFPVPVTELDKATPP